MKPIELWHGDCLELMKNIPDGSVDLVLTDPPYGTIKGIEKAGQARIAVIVLVIGMRLFQRTKCLQNCQGC